MAENKQYYWIKLKTDFFNSEQIDFLMSQENGCQYVVLYQMLCLNTANSNGEMATRIGEMIVPYNIEKIVRDTKYFKTDTVIVALELFKKMGLVYLEENNVLKISNFSEMVGSESKWAEKKRQYREKQKQLALGQSEDNVRQEYRDKSIEYRDKSIDIDKDNIVQEKKKLYFDNDNLNSIFEEFIEVRKKLKAVNSPRAIKTLINKLNKYNDETKYKMIENSIVNSWKDVYELKQNNSYKQPVRKEIVPDWMNKEVVGTAISKQEKEEAEELLKEFKKDEFVKQKVALQEKLKSKYGKGE